MGGGGGFQCHHLVPIRADLAKDASSRRLCAIVFLGDAAAVAVAGGGGRGGGREGDDCGGVFMDYYSESDESVDHKVMASIHSTPPGLTAHECDYRGKTVYLALITAAGNALYCFPQSSHFV